MLFRSEDLISHLFIPQNCFKTDILYFQCLPFWPENLSGKLCVRVVGCEGSSRPFFYNKQDNGTLLSLEDLVSFHVLK